MAASAAACSSTNAAPAVVAVPRDDDADDELREARRGLRPVERIAVVESGNGAVLDQVPGERDRGVRDLDDDVVVGMPATDVAELHAPVADVDVGRLGERAVGRIDDHLGQVGGHLGHLGGDPRPTDLAGPLDERRRSRSWPQIVAGRKTWLPKAWSKWPCVSTTIVTGVAVSVRRSSAISRAWTWVDRVSISRTSSPPSTTPMFWS